MTTTIRTTIADDAVGRICTLRQRGCRDPYALEACVEARGLSYCREYALDGTKATADQQLVAARKWCKAMSADLAERPISQEKSHEPV